MSISPDVLVLMFHGIGIDSRGQFELDVNRFANALDQHTNIHNKNILCQPVYWGGELQDRQGEMFHAMMGTLTGDSMSQVCVNLRRLIMLKASDALSMEHRAHDKESAYHRIQHTIRDQIDDIYEINGLGPDTPVVLVAQSLGCHILSSYIWDAQAQEMARHQGTPKPPLGIFKSSDAPNTDLGKRRRLKNARLMITTGCNIPLFLAGRTPVQAIETARLGYQFKWYNFYFTDDVLGWPLAPLSRFYAETEDLGQSYQTVKDVRLNDRDGRLLERIKNATPASHLGYWLHEDLSEHLAYMLRDLT